VLIAIDLDRNRVFFYASDGFPADAYQRDGS
jgi:hypothetical protein